MAGLHIDVRRAGNRPRTRTAWLDSAHSFSFGRHYDPDNLAFGSLLASNADTLAPGSGFEPHLHRDLEIVTWVLSGELTHSDDRGHEGVITPGRVQRLSAGSGVTHAERNSGRLPLELVQMWLRPDVTGTPPSWATMDLPTEPGLVPIAGGARAALSLHSKAVLWAGHLAAGQRVELPLAPLLHVYVASGSVHVESVGDLATGDAARLVDAGELRVVSGGRTEVLVWALPRA